jgi:hypothetical protein
LRQGDLLRAAPAHPPHRSIAKKAGCPQPAFYFGNSNRQAFITHSPNKTDGTADSEEHRPSPVVVGGAMKAPEEIFDE